MEMINNIRAGFMVGTDTETRGEGSLGASFIEIFVVRYYVVQARMKESWKKSKYIFHIECKKSSIDCPSEDRSLTCIVLRKSLR